MSTRDSQWYLGEYFKKLRTARVAPFNSSTVFTNSKLLLLDCRFISMKLT